MTEEVKVKIKGYGITSVPTTIIDGSAEAAK
jgi:hypothetical protein